METQRQTHRDRCRLAPVLHSPPQTETSPPPPRPRPAPPPFLPAITTRVAVATPRRPSRSRSSAPRRAVRRPAGTRYGGGRAGEAAPDRHRLRRALRREGRLPQLGTLRAGSHSGHPWLRCAGAAFNSISASCTLPDTDSPPSLLSYII